MATTTGQRVGIWVIAIMMVVGTIGGFLAMILVPKNEAQDQARQQQLAADYQAEYADYQTKMAAQGDELSKKYYPVFSKYEDYPSKFNGDNVEELKTKDLKQGTGEKLTEESTFTAYYVGWTPDGKVFDGSFEGEKLKAPFTVQPGQVIEGWTKGVSGMKVGGIRELTIPSDMAYGEAGSGETIPPNTPLKFLIYVIPAPEEVKAPEMPEELMQLYGQQ